MPMVPLLLLAYALPVLQREVDAAEQPGVRFRPRAFRAPSRAALPLRARSSSPVLSAAPEDSERLASFAAAGEGALPAWLVERAGALGFETPTPVQEEALDVVLAGRDAVIQAKTGSGKTLAYLLPLIAALRPQASVQALVLTPTRELARQVAGVARRLAAGSPERLLVMALLDGSGARRQRKWLRAQPPQVVVGNVEQVDRALSAGLLRLEGLRFLVVDEVDACLGDVNSAARLQRMLSGQLAVPTSPSRSGPLTARQTLFVSATVPQRQYFARQCLEQRWCREAPMLVVSEPAEVVPSLIQHAWAPCAPAKRVAALKALLRWHDPDIAAAIVFVQATMPLQRIAEALAGILDETAPAILAEDQSLSARAAALSAVATREKRLLLTTPLGVRGLDIQHCSHVYLLYLPASAEDYLHAAGRCGRIGQRGLVTVLCDRREDFALQRVANSLGIQFLDARPPAQ